MPTLTFQRTSEYQNRYRNIKLFVDDAEIGQVANGETKSFEVSAGKHKIIAKIDWCTSNELDLNFAANSSKTLKLGSNLPALMAIYTITIGRKNYLKLTEL